MDVATLLTPAAVITWGEAAAEPTEECMDVVEDVVEDVVDADAEAAVVRTTGVLEVRCAQTAKEDSVPQ